MAKKNEGEVKERKPRAKSAIVALRGNAAGQYEEVSRGVSVSDVEGALKTAIASKDMDGGTFLIVTVRKTFTAKLATVEKLEIN